MIGRYMDDQGQPMWPYPLTMMEANNLVRQALWPAEDKAPEIRIGLDIDNVCADMTLGIFREAVRRGLIDSVPENHRETVWIDAPSQLWKELEHTVWRDLQFIGSLPPLSVPAFRPVAYVSARSCNPDVSYEWLERHGFPFAPVAHTAGNHNRKPIVAKDRGINVFVEDNPGVFEIMEASGVLCLLVDYPYNRHLDGVGWKRISSLDDIPALMPRIKEELIERA